MSNWTNPALERLKHYLEQNRTRAAASGADAEEVATDLRQHIENEVAALKLPVVTEEDVQRIIARLGAWPETEAPAALVPPSQGFSGRRLFGVSGSVAPLFFGALLPLAALIIELATHICAGTFFDPCPPGSMFFWLPPCRAQTLPPGGGCAGIGHRSHAGCGC